MDNAHLARASASSSRAAMLLDQIHNEFQHQFRATAEAEYKLLSQAHEMERLQDRMKELQTAQLKMQDEYEAEIRGLHYQLRSSGVPIVSNLTPAVAQQVVPSSSQNFLGEYRNGYGPPPPTASPDTGLRPSTPPDSADDQKIKPSPSREPQPNILGNLSLIDLPNSRKKEGSGWYAVFNPEVPRVLDVELVHHFAHDSVASCVGFSPDGKYLATGCNRLARIFDVTTGENIITLQDDNLSKSDDAYVRSVCFSPDGKYLATGGEDRKLKVWDIGAGKIKHTFSGHEQDIYSVAFAGGGRYIASGSGDKTVRVWDVQRLKLVYTFNIEGGVTAVAVTHDGRFVAAASLDMNVQIWDITSGTRIERLEGPNGHENSVYCVAFAPSGDHVVSGSLDNTMKLWELDIPRAAFPNGGTGRFVRTFKGHKDFVLTACWAPHGNWIISGSKDQGVQFWDPVTATPQMLLQGHKNSVLSVAVSSTDNLFATGSGDRCARLWRYTTYSGQ